MKKILFLCFLLIIGVMFILFDLATKSGNYETEREVLIPRGANLMTVANKLKEAGIIQYPQLFRFIGRFNGLDKKLKAGEYVFAPNMSLVEVMQKIADGDIFYRRITLPEGLTTIQILELIMSEPLLSDEITVEVKEGELLPETYSFVRGDSRNSIVLQAKKAMQNTLDEVWSTREDELPLKRKEDLLVLASIVEKETGISEERGLVASVFVNRLKKGMKLQTDPTVIYALTQGKQELGRLLTRKDLKIDNPFNTYKYYGLPPAPICNPGRESLEAAAHPEKSDFIYFVASGDGGHNFATNLNEHNNNVRKWKKNKK
ncbi:MAG: endolytic transglycosylase MltG [Alphaproteobacteria bacterium]|nr:endolytic transglycosylase MltG [Alphaproteobacteria bacterium]